MVFNYKSTVGKLTVVLVSVPCSRHSLQLHVNLIITLSLGSMKTDRVISEPCYNEVIYNRHIAK